MILRSTEGTIFRGDHTTTDSPDILYYKGRYDNIKGIFILILLNIKVKPDSSLRPKGEGHPPPPRTPPPGGTPTVCFIYFYLRTCNITNYHIHEGKSYYNSLSHIAPPPPLCGGYLERELPEPGREFINFIGKTLVEMDFNNSDTLKILRY